MFFIMWLNQVLYYSPTPLTIARTLADEIKQNEPSKNGLAYRKDLVLISSEYNCSKLKAFGSSRHCRYVVDLSYDLYADVLWLLRRLKLPQRD